MTKYREILRQKSLGISERNIALSCNVSRNTVAKVAKRADEMNLMWPLPDNLTDGAIKGMMFPKDEYSATNKRVPDYSHIQKELMRSGVTKKLLWIEYCEDCRMSGEDPLMYSQFCYHIQQDEQKRRATMRIPRKPGEQVEVDWAGDPAYIIDPDTGEVTEAWLFVGVMTYSQHTYLEAFINQKQKAWILAHIRMYEPFGGVAKILVSDNCATAVNIKQSSWYTKELNTTYYEMAEHYGTVIIPARVRKPKDKPNVESSVNVVSMWITAALRNEQFFSLAELNEAIHEKLEEFNARLFQKKEGSRLSLFLEEEKPLMAPLPATRFELVDWRKATVQFNYHVAADKMYYSVPYQYIKNIVDVRVSESIIEVFCQNERIASHLLLDLETAKNADSYIRALGKYTKPTLLIIDEWLLMKLGESDSKHLFELIHKRRKKTSTIFCSQFREEGWYERLGGEDNPLADAIMDRIVYDAYKINIESINPAKDFSMREVYGLDQNLIQ